MVRRILAFPLALVLLTLVWAPFSLAADSTRPIQFVPVQDGFAREAPTVLPYAPDRLLVQFTEDGMERLDIQLTNEKGVSFGWETGLRSLDALASNAGVRSIERPYSLPKNEQSVIELGIDRWFLFRFDTRSDMADLAKSFAADPDVEAVSLDWRAFPAAVPNDPYHDDNWGHNNTAQLPDLDWGGTYDHTLPTTVGTPGFDANAQAAWDASQGYGSSSIVVAILDSGVDIDHDDLRLVAGYDYGDNDSNPDDNSAAPGHGTCCAGVTAAIVNNGNEVNGIAGGCSVMPLKVANSAGSMYFSSIVNAIYHAADNGADIVSMSFSADISSDASTDAAIQYAYNAGVVLLAATSNSNQSHIHYPANNAYVIGVGAASPCGERKRSSSNSAECNPGVSTDPNGYTCDGERWWGSNYGVNTRDAAGAVDIIAPTILPTTDIEGSGGYTSGDVDPFFNGTSCATPYAAGVCALIKSKNPTWTNVQIRDQLCNTAQDVTSVESSAGWDRYAGYGMVDAEAAVGGGGPVAPVAAFVGAPLSGSFPLNVSFTDQSSGAPTSWSWTFGDGGTSSAQNPSHTYTAAGTYTVSLTVSNSVGSDGETKTDYITVTEPGQTTFVTAGSETAVIGTVGGSYLDTKVSDDSRETITEVVYTGHPVKRYSYLQHEWSFDLPAGGDVTFHLEASRTDNAEGDNMAFEYSTDGVNWYALVTVGSATETAYSIGLGTLSGTVTVRATDTNRSWGNTALDVLSVDYMAFEVGDAQPQPPVADFVGTPTSGDYPLTVQFADASSGDPTSWSWTFGDGGNSTAQNPQHTYTAAGAYTVSLTATNAQGSDVETKTNYITVTEPGQGGTMFVQNMVVDRLKSGPNYVGRCVVTVHDDIGLPVANATVYADFDGVTSGSTSGVTGGDGTVTLQSSGMKKPSGEWCFEVTNITHADDTYDSASNVVTRACESGAVNSANGQFVRPSEFSLAPNQPNPFNPMTSIEFGLPRETSVRLRVFDVRGQLVATLVDETLGAGMHSMVWDARDAASGIYFYQLETPGFTETRKMMLLK
ncbi:MAG: S8 family serine peptidase [bacterium]